MAALAPPLAAPLNLPFQWTNLAALQLIRERRALQQQFEACAGRNQDPLWRMVSTNLFNNIGFVASPHQCRSKFGALTAGKLSQRKTIYFSNLNNNNIYCTYKLLINKILFIQQQYRI